MPFLVTDNASALATVARFYQIALGREPDANGLAFWAEAVDSGQLTLAQVGQAFLQVREGQDDLPDTMDDASFAAELIAAANGRDATQAEIDAAVADIEGGATRGAVLAEIGGSAEAQANLDVVGDAGLSIPDFAPSAFGFGVASGDPDATSVVLWTHARPDGAEGAVSVGWEVATDADFTDVVASGTATTSEADDYTVKAIAEGLAPGGEYFYRFTAGEETSITGQTRTLPEGAIDSLTFAVFSCSNLPAGWFNTYAEAANRGFDFAIHLGDYIYEYANGVFPADPVFAAETNRVPQPNAELITEDDYNARYAIYHRDTDLQAMRATAPLIMMWDDHETANDSWATGAENHQPEDGDWFERRDAALEAYHRWNPTRTPETELFDYDRSFEFGDLVDLTMFETRLQERDETRGAVITAVPTKIGEYAADPTLAGFVTDIETFGLAPEGVDLTDPAQVGALLQDEAFATQVAVTALLAEAADPTRDMVGDAQIAEFAETVVGSDATWQVIGSQTLMARMDLPAPALDQSLIPVYLDAVGTLLAGGTLTPEQEALFDQSATVPYNLDAWDGYVADREAILEILAQNDAQGIVLSGDTHDAWFSQIDTLGGDTVAFEFGGPGVSSTGLEDFFVDVPLPLINGFFTEGIDTLLYADTGRRGYMEVVFTPDAATSNYVFVDSVFGRAYEVDVVTQVVTAESYDDIG